jgi:hypothetical protein
LLGNHRVELDDDIVSHDRNVEPRELGSVTTGADDVPGQIPQSGSLVDGAGRDEPKVAELLLKVNGFRVQLGMSDRYEVVVGPAARRRPTSG